MAAVNDTTEKNAPKGAIHQIGECLSRIIHAFSETDVNAKVFMAKWDIKYGFWRMDCAKGEEWNFVYVLPQPEQVPKHLVTPTLLQMGWVESPPYFCAATEAIRDIATEYINTPVASLPHHKFTKCVIGNRDFNALLEFTEQSPGFVYMVEVYIYNFMSLVIPVLKAQLCHVATAVMSGIHDVSPPNVDDSCNPILEKKLIQGKGQYSMQKSLLGFDFDGLNKTMWLEAAKREKLLTLLKGWVQTGTQGTEEIPFKEFESTVAKIRHALTCIPAGVGPLSPCNRVLRVRPAYVFLNRNQQLLTAVEGCCTLLWESMWEPTKFRELVTCGWLDFVGIVDASGQGIGGVIIGELTSCTLTVFQWQWPEDVTANIKTFCNPGGTISNSDLEMAGLLLLWLAMEGVRGNLREKQVMLLSNNSPTVG